MKNEIDILMMKFIVRDSGYTGDDDRDSKGKTFFTKTLPKLVDQIQNKTFDENDLEGHGLEIIRPSNIINTYTR